MLGWDHPHVIQVPLTLPYHLEHSCHHPHPHYIAHACYKPAVSTEGPLIEPDGICLCFWELNDNVHSWHLCIAIVWPVLFSTGQV